MRGGGSSKLVTVLAGVLLFGAETAAQVYQGSISGRLTDPSGAALPGVLVTLTSPRILQPQSATSSETGAYRFSELPVATYTLSYELAGFRKLVREGILVAAGANVQLNVELAIGPWQEAIQVSGESPAVDVRQTGVPESFHADRLENLPSARNPWVLLEQTPGFVLDREDVGGNQSGNQSVFLSRGSRQAAWVYDGVNITDAASGASPMYYHFAAIEEINVTTGGLDPSMGPGTQINFIIKQGTDRLEGQAAFYGTDDSLQSTNIDDELRAQQAGAGAPIQYILDYGFDLGGPILRERAFLWGGYGVQDIHRGVVGFLKPGCTNPDDPSCLHDDPTRLKTANVKFNYQVSPKNRLNFMFTWNDKTRDTVGASFRTPLPTTARQTGGTYLYKFEDVHTVSSNLLFSGRLAYVDSDFGFDYQEPGLRLVQPTYELSTGTFGRSGLSASRTQRPQLVGNFDGNYLRSKVLGGDHELKFGFQYKRTPVDSFTTYGGDVWATFEGGRSVEALFYRPSAIAYQGTLAAGYLQDIYTRRRVTLKLGVRYDYSVGRNKPSSIPANMVIPDLMPPVDFPGTDPVDPWQTLSPRLGFTYDFTGDGKTIVRAGYSRYYDLLGLEQIRFTNGAHVSTLALPWNDLNGDRVVQANEVDTSTILYLNNFDPARRASLSSPNVRDPNLSPPRADEVIVGFEREVISDFSIGVNYIVERFSNLLFADPLYFGLAGNGFPFVGVPASAFVPVATTFQGQQLTYYQLAPGFTRTGDLLTNWPNYHRRYQGLEITGNKRFSRRWMLDFGFTLQGQREYFEGPAALYDPTNSNLRDGGQLFLASAASFMNSRWTFKLDGMVELPGGFYVAGKLNGRQGFVYPRTFRTPNRAGGLGRVEVLLEPIGESRLDALWLADLRVEKTFELARGRLSAMMDVFNLANAATVLSRERRQNLANANRVQTILAPRVVRFGVRFTF